MIHFVYLITNKINNKQYIGSHTGEENDNYLGSGILIKKAIKKYGRNSFNRKIIKECNTKEEAVSLEEYYIKEFDTLIPQGYNISEFGNVTFSGEKNPMYGKIPWNKNKKLSKITREKISESLKGNKRRLGIKHSEETKKKISNYRKGKPTFKNKKHTEESKRKMSESHKGLKPGNYGKKHTEESKRKMSESHKGINNFKNMPIGKCKYCGKEMKMSHLNRYHNEKCKYI